MDKWTCVDWVTSNPTKRKNQNEPNAFRHPSIHHNSFIPLSIHPSNMSQNKQPATSIFILFYIMVQVKLYASLPLSSLTPFPSIGVEILAEDPLLLSRFNHDATRLFGAIRTFSEDSVGWNDVTDVSASSLGAIGELWKQSVFSLINWETGFSSTHKQHNSILPCGFRVSFSSCLKSRVTSESIKRQGSTI